MRGWRLAPSAGVLLLLATVLAVTVEVNAEEGFAALESQIHEFKLPNGMTFLVLERHDAPVFSFRTYVNAGSVDEVTGITGIAHMFEHMAFKGTPHIGTNDFDAEREAMERVDEAWQALLGERRRRHQSDPDRLAALEEAFKATQKEADTYVVSNEFSKVAEQAGATGFNAFTGVDFTQYLYNLPSNKIELWALLEGDRMSNPVLREFYKERDVVIEERRMRSESSPSGRLFTEFIQTAFAAHPYGYGGIGHRSDIETFTREEAKEFHKKYYVAKNMIVAVVGDVEAAEVERLAKKYFSTISDSEPAPPVDTVEPPQYGERRVVIEDEAQPMIFLGYHMPDFNDPDYVSYDAVSEVLGDGRSSRLYTSLVKEKKLAVQVGVSTGMPGRKYPCLMFGYIVPAADVDPEDALVAFDEEIEKLLNENPVTPEELDGIKTRYRARYLRRIQSNQGLAGQLATYQGITGDWRNLFKRVDQVGAITIDSVTEAAKAGLKKSNRTVAILRPRAEES